ncbi:hypothetical protein GN316_15450 [Xylophilus sp. Kf1]|nr:hypothetical protein [Xylophilus sp. Kf1]
MSIKEREPSTILLAITTAQDGSVTVSTDLGRPAAIIPLCPAERLAVEFLSIAAHCGHAVSALPDVEDNPAVAA